jgi:hypothetical protein
MRKVRGASVEDKYLSPVAFETSDFVSHQDSEVELNQEQD